MEILRNKGLTMHKGNYDSVISLNEEVRNDILWWIHNINGFPKSLCKKDIDVELYSDASLQGYGVFCDGKKTQGLWTESERQLHINVLELLAVKQGLLSFFSDMNNIHIHIFSDNSVTVTSLTRMGSNKTAINSVVRDIWLFCKDRSLNLTVSYIPGSLNNIADSLSRSFNVELEWKLNPYIFGLIQSLLGPFDMDLFASRINFQFQPYVSWAPDPEAWGIDAFHFSWKDIYGYSFPPFSIIAKVLQKIEIEECEMCVIVPFWKTQCWFPKLGKLLIDTPLLLPKSRHTLIHPLNEELTHPLQHKLQLVACKLSGKPWKNEVFLQKQQESIWNPGEKVPKSNMNVMCNNSYAFVSQGKLIHAVHLPVQ